MTAPNLYLATARDAILREISDDEIAFAAALKHIKYASESLREGEVALGYCRDALTELAKIESKNVDRRQRVLSAQRAITTAIEQLEPK